MPKSYLVCFLLWILLQILIEVNCQTTPFKPSSLYRHTATLIDNKLYILGGNDLNTTIEKDFFYLDVSVPFNTQNLLWQDLSSIDILPPHEDATSVKGGPNNDTLFLYGGFTTDQTMALVYIFNPQSNSWSIPKITGVNTVRKDSLTGINYNGKMYLWGGCSRDLNNNCVFENDMLILDTINLSWGKGSLINAPIPRAYHGTALLPNNNIIYIGGFNDNTSHYIHKTLNIDNGSALTLSEIYIYDIMNDNWSTKITSGKIPSNRAGFSSILDGQRIIIFGGVFINPGYFDTTLYVLDLTNFNWYIPNISGKIPSPRFRHQANIIGKYMVISFGEGYNRSIENDILLLDISNNDEYVWTTTFDPAVPNNIVSTTSSPLSSSSNNNPSNNTPVVVGAIAGSLFGGILLSFSVFFLYKWNKNKQNQKNVIKIYGNAGYNNNNQEGIPTSTESNNEQKSMLTILRNFITNRTSRNEVMTIPAIINRNSNQGQEIMQTPRYENTTNHEPINPAPVDRNYNQGQEDNDRLSLQIFKDELLQAVKQENQNLKNEILQVVTKENSDNIRNNER
ncbi:hypothetical protein C1645_826777 [Glomus cerebriforme]|uniref:Galactose oxidase n=1 Tax=Glomus cerebriforme TaxID=658196 RepID=A0A397SZ43_9GLOM|nr:hypothetical protein C1645_826777 [Glomus cerebriforme]